MDFGDGRMNRTTMRVRKDITKEEAARRQLDRAILMYLEDDDDICTHVVATAAATILTQYCKSKGLDHSQKQMLERVKPEFRSEFLSISRRAFNFFKHSNNDPDGTLPHFDEEINALTIFLAIRDYKKAFGQTTSAMMLFQFWFVNRWPELIENPVFLELTKEFFGDAADLSYKELKRAGLAKLRKLGIFEEAMREHGFAKSIGKIVNSSDYLHNVEQAPRRVLRIPKYFRS